MKYVKLLPPGSMCNHRAFLDIITKVIPTAKTFIDIGCGGGDLSRELLMMPLDGVGIDFSPLAIEITKRKLHTEIEENRYQAYIKDIVTEDITLCNFDVGVCNMVMEHVLDDVAFTKECIKFIKPGGYFLFAVPAKMSLWSKEDESVGHLRRYERNTLKQTLSDGGLQNVQIYSVAVPISNILFGLNKWVVKRFEKKAERSRLSQNEQTQYSGISDIPWKTAFPRWVKIFINRYTMHPLFMLQRVFYKTDYGHILIGFGQVSESQVRSE